MEPKKSKITVRDVSRSFVSADGAKVDALENINFEIEDAYSREGRDIGEFRVLLGPSGMRQVNSPALDRRSRPC